jgi:hypothetical protein
MDKYGDMGKKIRNVGLIIVIVVVLCLMITIFEPLFIKTSNIIVDSNTTGNYWGYKATAKAFPLWAYGIPVLIGGVLIWLELRAPVH